MKVRLALIGLGKMGISHLAIVRPHPDVELVAVCDSSGYLADTLSKYSGLKTYTDYQKMLEQETLDGVVIATPSKSHAAMVRAALNRNLHVFCEKPFCIDPVQGRALAEMAQQKGLINQVGYHYRFVGPFNEAKRLIDGGVIGRLHNVRAEAYGPVVLRPKNVTWRAQSSEGGGCLYDYACHAIDLLNYFVGKPDRVGGTVLNSIFSREVEDEVYSSFFFPNGLTAQLASNWSDESHRKMFTKLSFWGSNGKLTVDRQELQLFVRDDSATTFKVKQGWTSIYATDLHISPFFYLRGEEYSDQIDHFVQAILTGNTDTRSTFASAVETDEVASMMVLDAKSTPLTQTLKGRSNDLARGRGVINKAKALFS